MVGGFSIRDMCRPRCPMLLLKDNDSSGPKLRCMQLGRPFSRGLGGLGTLVTRAFPARSVVFCSLARGLSRRCASVAHFQGTMLLTSVSVFFVTLVKLLKCINSRVHFYEGRVTVQGIGNTSAYNVLGLFSTGML